MMIAAGWCWTTATGARGQRPTATLPQFPAQCPPHPAVIAPVPGGDLPLYADRRGEVKEAQVLAPRERQERQAAERQAKAGESRHGPCWWGSPQPQPKLDVRAGRA